MAQFSLPQPVNALAAITAGRDARAAQDQRQGQNRMRELMGQSDFGTPEGRQVFQSEAMKLDPQTGLQFMELFDRMDDRSREQAMNMKKDAARIALQIADAPESQRSALWRQAQSMYPEVYSGPYAIGAEQQIIGEAQTFDDLLKQRQARESAEAEARKPVSLSEGGALVDPSTGKIIVQRPKTYAPQQPPVAPEALRILEAMGVDPKSDEGKKLLERKFMGGATAPSSFSEKRAYWEDIYREAGDPDWKAKAGRAAQSSSADSIPEAERPAPLPDDQDDWLDDTWYALPDGRVAKYLGDDQWELAE